jgi:hypothetical protein
MQSTLRVPLNGKLVKAACDWTRGAPLQELQAGLNLARHSGGFIGRRQTKSTASACMVFNAVADPNHKHRVVSALSGELLQRAIEELEESELPRGCIPSWMAEVSAPHQLIVRVNAVGNDQLALVEKLAFSLGNPLMRLIEPDQRPWLILGTALHSEVVVECQLKLFDESGMPQPGNDNTPMATDRALKSLGAVGARRTELASRDNERVLSALSQGLGLGDSALTNEWRAHTNRWGSEEPLVHWWRRAPGLSATLTAPEPLDTSAGGTSASDAPILAGCIALAASLGHAAATLSVQGLQLGSRPANEPRWTANILREAS